MSGHKTLAAFSQGVMLHAVDRGLVDLDRLDASFEALMTTSASGLIHASLDQTRAPMEREGAGLVEAAIELAEGFRARIDGFLSPQPVLSPRDAFFAQRERVPAAGAAGRVAAGTISPYPPGIPAIAPGELVTTDLLDALRTGPGSGRPTGRPPARPRTPPPRAPPRGRAGSCGGRGRWW
jgi:arginine/lysine/ornithine decarboxylase